MSLRLRHIGFRRTRKQVATAEVCLTSVRCAAVNATNGNDQVGRVVSLPNAALLREVISGKRLLSRCLGIRFVISPTTRYPIDMAVATDFDGVYHTTALISGRITYIVRNKL